MPWQDKRVDVGLKNGSDEKYKHVADAREQEVKPDSMEKHNVAQEEEKEHVKRTSAYDDE